MQSDLKIKKKSRKKVLPDSKKKDSDEDTISPPKTPELQTADNETLPEDEVPPRKKTRYTCSWKKECVNAARYCSSISSKIPQCCEICKQQGSINIDYYDLKNRGGFPFGKEVLVPVPEPKNKNADQNKDGSDSFDSDS